jgi:hypothetical protein
MMLKHNRTRDQIVQANTHTQRHMHNIYREMVILTPLSCSLLQKISLVHTMHMGHLNSHLPQTV